MTPTRATLAGEAFTNTGGNVESWFEYGKTRAYDNTTQHDNAEVPKDRTQPRTASLTGLDFGSDNFEVKGKYQLDWTVSVLGSGSGAGLQSSVRVSRRPSSCNFAFSVCDGWFENEWTGNATAEVTCLSIAGDRAVIGTGPFRGDHTEQPQLLTVVDQSSTDRFRADPVSSAPTSCPAPPADVSGIPPTSVSDRFVVHEAFDINAASR